MNKESNIKIEDKEFFFLDIIILLISNIKLIIRNLIIYSILILLILFIIPNKYISKASFIPPTSIEDTDFNPVALINSLPLSNMLKNNDDVFLGLLESQTICYNIIRKFNLMELWKLAYIEDAYKKLTSLTEIESITGIINIEVETDEPNLSKEIANEYINQLSIIINNLNTNSAKTERVFLEERLNAIHKELTTSSRKLTEYQITNKLIDINKQGSSLIDTISQLQTQIIILESTIKGLSSIYTDKNPKIISEKKKLDVLKSKLLSLKGNKEEAINFNKKNKEDDISLLDIPSKAIDYIELQRDVKILEEVFSLINQQYEISKLKEAKEKIILKVVDKPELATVHSSPKRFIIFILLFILSLFTNLFYIYFKDRINKLKEIYPSLNNKINELNNKIRLFK